jgi:hypothetical protein
MAITVFPSEQSAPAKSPSENDRVPISLTFSNNDTMQMYYNFMKSRTSSRMAFWSSFIFTFYVVVMNGVAGYDGSTSEQLTVFIIRKARGIVCVLIWSHYYHLRKDTGIAATSKFWDLRNLVVSGNFIVVLNSLMGGLLLVLQSPIKCTEGSNSLLCNKYYELQEISYMIVVNNVLAMVIFPSIMKIHSPIALFVSWIVNMVSLAIACYFVKDWGGFGMLSVLYIFVGISIYDTKRGTIDMFLTLQEKEQYYKEALVQEQSKIAAEFEKNQLKDMIGNVAHDLKTPLQAFMSELSGVRREVQYISSRLRNLQTLLVSCDDDCIKDELAQRVLANVNELTSSVVETNKYLASLEDIYSFMIMAINRAIEFRKTASGVGLLPVFETFNLTDTVKWATMKFVNNPTGVEVSLTNHPN